MRMKKLQYKVIVSDKGFTDFEEKVSQMLNEGWKPIGGIAFNHSFPHQAMAKVIEMDQEEKIITEQARKEESRKALTANEAMKRLDDLT